MPRARVRGRRLESRVISVLLLSVAITLLPSPCPASDEPVDIHYILEEVRDRTGIPAIAAAVSRDGQIVAEGAVGVRALGSPAPVSPGDRFLIGSCAKSMLRVLVGRLADTGLLSFDTTLEQALTGVPMLAEYRDVTIGQILNHKGGIPPYTQIGPRLTPWLFELKGTAVEQRASFAAHILNEPPAAPPGSQEIYSNAGYGIVAHVAERLAGRPWEELLAQQVFTPLAMSSAMVGLPTSPENQDGPRGHFRNETGYELTKGWRQVLPPIAPAGMVSCTIGDFARFAGKLALINWGKPGDLLKEATAARVAASTPGGGPQDGVPFFGGEGTFTAAFALWPSRGLAIVVQTNGGESDNVCQAAIEAVRQRVAPDAPAFVLPFNRNPHGVTFFDRKENDWIVDDVADGGSAAKAGVQIGDRLSKLNGIPIEEMDLQARVQALRSDRVTLTVRRGDQDLDVTLGTQGK
jgi:CubicO group peptidase (beta-lactamase class C family)